MLKWIAAVVGFVAVTVFIIIKIGRRMSSWIDGVFNMAFGIDEDDRD